MSDTAFEPTTIVDQPIPFLNGSFSNPTGSATNPIADSGVESPNTIQDALIPRNLTAQEVISTSLNTETKKIMAEFSFEQAGAMRIGNFSSGATGDILISPTGILGRDKTGATTFSVDGSTGDATFKGTVAAGSIVTGYLVVGGAAGDINDHGTTINGNKLTTGTVTADYVVANISISAPTISGGTINAVTLNSITINGGNININNNFIVNSVGNVTCQDVTITNGIFFSEMSLSNGEILGQGGGYLNVATGHGNTETHHLDPTTQDIYNLGGSSRWWFAINYHFLTKQGGFGVFDEGVEMQDGRILSDTEALLAMKPDKVRKEWGKPIFDFETLPKVIRVYPKTNDGKLVPKNKDGKYIDEFGDEHQEGEDVNAMISLLIGAVRELTVRVKKLETKSV